MKHRAVRRPLLPRATSLATAVTAAAAVCGALSLSPAAEAPAAAVGRTPAPSAATAVPAEAPAGPRTERASRVSRSERRHQLEAAVRVAAQRRHAAAASRAEAAAERRRRAERAARAKKRAVLTHKRAAEKAKDPRNVARALLDDHGWGKEQFSCLNLLWTKESGWSAKADNPTSSAYGIPQALPGAKMASEGSDWRTNPKTQIRWGLGYIEDRYGTPCAAWAHSRASNWY